MTTDTVERKPDIQSLFGDSGLTTKTISVRASEMIRSKIIRGELPPGTHLKETEFAEALGISKACVREAFLILAGEGLVTRVANKSTCVISYTQKDILDFYDYRKSIEMMCLELALKNGTLNFDALAEKLDNIREVSDSECADVSDYIESDLAFHDEIVRSSQNRWAIREWNILSSVMRHIYYLRTTHEAFPIDRQNYELHAAIYEPAKNGDTAAALAALAEHIESNKAIIQNS